MDELYYSLKKYFTTLENTGYISNNKVNKLVAYSAINDILNTDFQGWITEKDYKIINRALYCLYGSNCLIPFPDYYSKNNRTMYKGSISELAYRVDSLEDLKEKTEKVLKNDVVIPGDLIAEVDDPTV